MCNLYYVICASVFFFGKFYSTNLKPQTNAILNDKIINQLTNAKNSSDQNPTTTIQFPDKLPNFENGKAGGVIIFYHVAKTGGSTIRDLFLKISEDSHSRFVKIRVKNPPLSYSAEEYDFRKKHEQFTSCVPPGKDHLGMKKIDKRVMNVIRGKRLYSTLLVEVHGTAIGLNNLSVYIDKWRQRSEDNGTPFFAFTLVREPVAFSLSYFQFYYLAGCDGEKWCEGDHEKYRTETEENLILSTKPNRQCFFLTHLSSIEGLHPSFYDKCAVTTNDCNTLYQTMKESLDWIGTTESISNETLPLLMHILRRTSEVVEGVQNMKVSNRTAFAGGLSEDTTNKIKHLTEMDQMIYEKVKTDYHLNKNRDADNAPIILHDMNSL